MQKGKSKQRTIAYKRHLVSPFVPIWPVLPDGGEAIVRSAMAEWGGHRDPSLVVGVNEVTKRLEKAAACHVVFVCRSAEPAMLTRHVLQLAAGRGVPVCAFNGFGDLASQLLGIRKVAAMAIFEAASAIPPDGFTVSDQLILSTPPTKLEVFAAAVRAILAPCVTRVANVRKRLSDDCSGVPDTDSGLVTGGALVPARVRKVPLPDISRKKQKTSAMKKKKSPGPKQKSPLATSDDKT